MSSDEEKEHNFEEDERDSEGEGNKLIEEEAEVENDGGVVEDSSEESEGPDEYVVDNEFIVDEVEDDRNEDEDSKSEKERRKKKKKKRRALEADDFMLLEENTGISILGDESKYQKHGGYSRLKKRKQKDDIEDEIEDDFRVNKKTRLSAYSQASDGENEEEEEEEEEESRYLYRTTTPSMMSNAHHIFGGDEVLDYITPASTDEPSYKQDRYEMMKEQYEPSVIAENFFTTEDDKIREMDIPERLQYRLANQKTPSKNELLKEIDWMLDFFPPHINQKFNSYQISAIHIRDQIYSLLHFFRVDKFEIPYIDRYKRKDHCPDVETSDLWNILDLDEKWCHFKLRKKSLKRIFINAHSTSDKELDYLAILNDCRSLDELNDLLQHFHLYHPELLTESESSTKHRNPNSDQFTKYKLCVRAGLKRMVDEHRIVISAEQLGEALELNSFTIQDPIMDYTEFAMEFMKQQPSEQFSNINTVRKAIIYLLSTEISCDPKVRKYIRNEFYEAATISTSPTDIGKVEIDQNHSLRAYKRLKEKPVKSLSLDNLEFAQIRLGEKEGLLKITISIPENTHNQLLKKLMELYCTSSRRKNSEEWNELRQQILQEALKERLYPIFQKSLYQKLLSDAKEKILSICYTTLKKMCNTGPYEMKPGRVMAAICGETNRDPVICATVDIEGELINTIRIDNLLYNRFSKIEDREIGDPKVKLREFMEDTKPKVIVVGATNLESRKLMETINAILQDIQSRYEQIATAIYGIVDVPRICSLTSEYEKEFAEYPSNVRLAISLARYTRDPITQISLLFHKSEDIYALSLHPLQTIIEKYNFANCVQRAVIDSVNMIGVELNQVIDHPYRFATLQFVCGLGPRKAAHLKQRIVRNQHKIFNRLNLKNYFTSGDVVLRNAVGFIKVTDKYLLGSYSDSYFELDGTRIHPDDYNYAIRMIKDALGESSGQSRSGYDSRTASSDSFDSSTYELHQKTVNKFFMKNRNDAIRRLNISQSLRELDPEGTLKIERKLIDIKDELLNGFQDFRVGYVPPRGEELFFHLTGDNIAVDHIITVTVITLTNDSIIVKLDSGITGIIERNYISDKIAENPHLEIKNHIHVGQLITCRVLSVDKENFTVKLSCKSSDLNKQTISLDDDEDDIRDKPKPKKDFVPKTRVIKHPLFRQITYTKAEEDLADAPSGEVIFRPSSKGLSHLTLTFKFHDTVAHVDITEEDKPSPLELGRKLRILSWSKNEVFEDLNEIVARYIEPIIMYSAQMKKFRRFEGGSDEHLENILRAEKEASPHSIPYRVCVSHEAPGRYKLLYLPNRSVQKEFITCTPDGYRFRSREYKSPEELITWFKKNWRDMPSKNPSKIDTNNTSAPSTSLYDNQRRNQTHRPHEYNQPRNQQPQNWQQQQQQQQSNSYNLPYQYNQPQSSSHSNSAYNQPPSSSSRYNQGGSGGGSSYRNQGSGGGGGQMSSGSRGYGSNSSAYNQPSYNQSSSSGGNWGHGSSSNSYNQPSNYQSSSYSSGGRSQSQSQSQSQWNSPGGGGGGNWGQSPRNAPSSSRLYNQPSGGGGGGGNYNQPSGYQSQSNSSGGWGGGNGNSGSSGNNNWNQPPSNSGSSSGGGGGWSANNNFNQQPTNNSNSNNNGGWNQSSGNSGGGGWGNKPQSKSDGWGQSNNNNNNNNNNSNNNGSKW